MMRTEDDLVAGPEEEELMERDPCENCGERCLQIADVDVRGAGRNYWAIYTVRCPTCGHEEERHVGGDWE